MYIQILLFSFFYPESAVKRFLGALAARGGEVAVGELVWAREGAEGADILVACKQALRKPYFTAKVVD